MKRRGASQSILYVCNSLAFSKEAVHQRGGWPGSVGLLLNGCITNDIDNSMRQLAFFPLFTGAGHGVLRVQEIVHIYFHHEGHEEIRT